MRYFLDISYKGTHYAGWQIQPNAHTVQAELDNALSTLLREEIRSMGAGRTDAGVHARQLLVHFDTEVALPDRFLHGINGILPYDISAHALLNPTRPDLHARFDAIHRSYVYQLTLDKSPFHHEFAYWIRQAIDIEHMNKAAALLPTYEDFASFCKAHGDNQTTLCRLDHAYWEQKDELLLFHVQANRFLRGMVRALVGTLLWVGTGKIDIQQFRQIIEAKDRTVAGPSAAPQGLFLREVGYKKGSFTILQGVLRQQ